MGGIRRSRIGTVLVAATSTIALSIVLPAAAKAVSVSIVGPEQIVFDWTTMRCSDADVGDGVGGAFRDYMGRIQVLSGSPTNHRMIGPDFNSLTRDCNPTFVSARDADAAHLNDADWLAGVWTGNGTDVYGLVHNEYHGTEHVGACPSGRLNRCLGLNAVTFAYSQDGGETYQQPAPPNHFVATTYGRGGPDRGRIGYFAVSSPLKYGNYWYSMMILQGNGNEDSGVCVMRSPDITNPSTWRGWDGAGFNVKFTNPYYEVLSPSEGQICEPVSPNEILQTERSIIFDTFLNKFVVVGTASKWDPSQNRYVWGVYYSTSDDLIHWSMRQLIMETVTVGTYMCGGPDPIAYPIFIDPDSTDRNFKIGDANVDLYYVRIHYNAACIATNDRDLLRVPLQFSP
jgi:hypothetical protein